MKGSKRFSIGGMHCAACVALVQREFEAVKGTISASVNLAEGTATVTWEGEGEPDDAAYTARIEPFGYEAARVESALRNGKKAVGEKPRTVNGVLISWLLSALAAAGIFGLYWLLQAAGIADKAAARTEATIVAALFAGAAASVSSCLALVGSLVLALGSLGSNDPAGSVRSAGGSTATPFARNLLFQGGRIGGFAFLGGLLGLLGGGFVLSGRAVSVLTVSVGLLTFILGLSLLGVFPSGMYSRLPRRFSRALDTLASSPHPASPILLGVATFFLPCGFTLSMQALALTSGGFGRGAAIMGAFALGTSPVLFGVGLAGAWTKRRGVVLSRAAGLVVIAFAVQSILSGASLFGFTGNVMDTTAAAVEGPPGGEALPTETRNAEPTATAQAEVTGDIQRVSMRVLASAFEPAVIRVKAGVPVEWTILGENPSGCTNRIVIPGADVSIPISRGGSQVVRFTVDEPGTIPFSCWMGMVRGKIVVD